MEIYLVGGAVRDKLSGRPIKEQDYVVVGATPEALVARGFKPVGADFPVFIHPKVVKNMLWRVLSANQVMAIRVLHFTVRLMSL